MKTPPTTKATDGREQADFGPPVERFWRPRLSDGARKPSTAAPPLKPYPADKARGGEIILRTTTRKAIFIAGAGAFAHGDRATDARSLPQFGRSEIVPDKQKIPAKWNAADGPLTSFFETKQNGPR